MFEYNAAIRGGVFYCKACSLFLDISSLQNSRAYEGGAIYVESFATTPASTL